MSATETVSALRLPGAIETAPKLALTLELAFVTVMDAADDALYAAKAGGRNMTQVSHGVRVGRLVVTEQR